MANAGLPGTSGFVGEFFVVLGAVQYQFWIGLVAASTLIWGAAYSLWMYKRVIFGAVANERVAGLADIGHREFWMLTAMALLVLGMGVYPKPVTDMTEASVKALLEHVAVSKLEKR
jgi:NADH-quinone oxidoreductase subunit M